MSLIKKGVIGFYSCVMTIAGIASAFLLMFLLTPFGWIWAIAFVDKNDIPAYQFISLYALVTCITIVISRIGLKVDDMESSSTSRESYSLKSKDYDNDKKRMYVVRNLDGKEVYEAQESDHKISNEDGNVLCIERFPGYVVFSCSAINHTAALECAE